MSGSKSIQKQRYPPFDEVIFFIQLDESEFRKKFTSNDMLIHQIYHQVIQ